MDLLTIFYSFILTLILYLEGIVSIQVSSTVSNQPAILGGSVTLQCSFTLDTATEVAGTTILLQRQSDAGFSTIVSFPFSIFDRFNVSYINTSFESINTSFESRTVATKPENKESSSVSFRFNNVECGDAAQYQWIVNYNTGGIDQTEKRTTAVTVKAEGTFSGSADFGLTQSPDTQDVVETTNVTFRCKAELGSEPTGQLAWYYYPGGSSSPVSVSDQARKEALTVYNTCSYTQVSTLVLTMTQQMNGVVVRCTMQQDSQSPDGDNGIEHRQTNPFNVSYSPRQTTVVAYPSHTVYSEGESSVNLTCSAVANPTASYSWLLPDGSESAGRTYQLSNLQINNTGNYTCLSKNGIPNENYTDTYTHLVVVVEKTTTTTSTTPSTTPGATGKPTSAPTTDGDDDDKTTIIIIVVCVVAGVAIIVVIIVIVVCRKKKKQEIEEPPEKPRNNQDLNFAGYRPGSNESLKNSGNNLNTSFNSFDSTDSKPRNEDGLMYVDLQFDDRPRSRRPIQVYDNGTATQYADIAMPRV